jgi:hypothetical protein
MARTLPEVVWTGDQLFVFGGLRLDRSEGDFVDDGYLLDPATGSRTPVPPLVLDEPLAFPAGVAVRGDVYLLGQRCGTFSEGDDCDSGRTTFVRYDPIDEQWEELPLEPLGASRSDARYELLGVTSDGRIVAELETARRILWTYDTSDGSFWQLPADDADRGRSCLMGDTVVSLLGGARSRPVHLQVLDLAGEEQWETVEPPRSGPASPVGGSIACADRAVLVFGAERPAVLWSASDGWEATSERPDAYLEAAAVTWTGDEFVFPRAEFGEQAWAYAPAADRWRRLPDPPRPVLDVVWTGEQLIGTPWLTTGSGVPPLAHTPYALDLS